MKAMICFTHPAWVHQFHHIIWRMRERGDEVLCFVAEKDGNSTLLERYGIPYVRCAKSTGKNPVEKALLFLKLSAQFSLAALKWKPDIMIGRAAEGDPWIFKRVNHYLETGELLPLPTREERREMILRHAKMQLDEKGENCGMREMRKHVAWYTAGLPHSARLRGMVGEISTYHDLEVLLEKYL